LEVIAEIKSRGFKERRLKNYFGRTNTNQKKVGGLNCHAPTSKVYKPVLKNGAGLLVY
jgi:hypothetical protein